MDPATLRSRGAARCRSRATWPSPRPLRPVRQLVRAAASRASSSGPGRGTVLSPGRRRRRRRRRLASSSATPQGRPPAAGALRRRAGAPRRRRRRRPSNYDAAGPVANTATADPGARPARSEPEAASDRRGAPRKRPPRPRPPPSAAPRATTPGSRRARDADDPSERAAGRGRRRPSAESQEQDRGSSCVEAGRVAREGMTPPGAEATRPSDAIDAARASTTPPRRRSSRPQPRRRAAGVGEHAGPGGPAAR